MASPTPSPTVSTIRAAPAQPPSTIGKAPSSPKRTLWLSTSTLVGPGVMDATKANRVKGNSSIMSGTSLRLKGATVHRNMDHGSGSRIA